MKCLGLPLKQIGRLLKQGAPLAETLRRQQHVLAGKRRQLDLAIQAIAQAARSVQSGRDPDWDLFTTIVKEIEMQNSTDWSKKYYSEDAKAKVEERKALWSPELQAQVTQQWTELVADVTATLEDDPAGPTAQALAARWRTLLERFTGGDPEVQKGLNTMWADKANWPARERERFHIDPRVQEFITTAMKLRGESGSASGASSPLATHASGAARCATRGGRRGSGSARLQPDRRNALAENGARRALVSRSKRPRPRSGADF